jgi:hypothetical protein
MQSVTAGTSISVSGLTQTAGSGRIVFVGISFESSNAPETVSAPQWAGVSMTPVTDGTTVARGTAGSGFSAWCQYFQVLEADLPADAGTKTFTCTLSGSPAEGAIHVVVVGDGEQSANVADVDTYGVAGSGNPNWSVTAPGDASVVIGMAACGNSGTFSPSAGFTEAATEQNLGSSGHHGVAGVFGAGTVNSTHSFSGTVNRATAAGFVVANGVTVVDVDGSLTQAAASASGELVKVRDVDGALSQAAGSVVGELVKVRAIAGPLTQAAATVASTLGVTPPTDIDGALSQAAATVAGSLDVTPPTDIDGALTQAAASVSASLEVSTPTLINGALTQAAAYLVPNTATLSKNTHTPTLDADTGVVADGGTLSQTVRPGTNRMMLGWVILRDGAPSAISLSTGGQAFTQRQVVSNTTGDGSTVALFLLFEADFPADGPQTIQVNFTSTDAAAFVHVTQLDRARQLEGTVRSSSLGTFTGGSFNAGGNNQTFIPNRGREFAAISVHRDETIDYSGRLLFGTGANFGTGLVASSDADGRLIRVFDSEQALEDSTKLFRAGNEGTSIGGSVPQASITVSAHPAVDSDVEGVLTQAAASVSSELVKVREIEGALTQAASTVAGELVKVRSVEGALNQPAATQVGELVKVRGIEGPLAQPAATGSGELNRIRSVDGALSQAAATVLGVISVGDGVDGFLFQAAASVSGSLGVSSSVLGAALTQAAASVAAEFTRTRQVDGALSQSSSVSGSLQVRTPLLVDGALSQGSGQVAAVMVRVRIAQGNLGQPGGSLAGSLGQTHQLAAGLAQAAASVAGSLDSQTPTQIDGALSQPGGSVFGSLGNETLIVGALVQVGATVAGSLSLVFTGSLFLDVIIRRGNALRVECRKSDGLAVSARNGNGLVVESRFR